jgi:hypothetical protein
MFADFVRLICRRRPTDYERGFVRSVKVSEKPPRNRRIERFIYVCWGIILLKSAAVFWLFDHYHVPVNPMWVVAPTLIFATLCTVVYLLRD